EFFLGDPQYVVDGDDTQQDLVTVQHRQGHPVVHLEGFAGSLLVVIDIQCDIPVVDHILYPFLGVGEDDLPDPDVIDKDALFVDDIDDVYRFAIFSHFPDMVDHLPDGPVLLDGDIIRRHQPADAAFRVTQQRKGDLSFLRVQRPDQLLHHFTGQLFQEGGPVIRGEVVQQLCSLESRQFLDDPL